jgi:hypothetical protein
MEWNVTDLIPAHAPIHQLREAEALAAGGDLLMHKAKHQQGPGTPQHAPLHTHHRTRTRTTPPHTLTRGGGCVGEDEFDEKENVKDHFKHLLSSDDPARKRKREEGEEDGEGGDEDDLDDDEDDDDDEVRACAVVRVRWCVCGL